MGAWESSILCAYSSVVTRAPCDRERRDIEGFTDNEGWLIKTWMMTNIEGNLPFGTELKILGLLFCHETRMQRPWRSLSTCCCRPSKAWGPYNHFLLLIDEKMVDEMRGDDAEMDDEIMVMFSSLLKANRFLNTRSTTILYSRERFNNHNHS